MKKFHLLLVAVVGISLLALSCAKNATATSTTLSWLVHPAYSATAADQARANYVKGAIAEWQTKYPNVKLDVNVLPANNAEAMAKLQEQAAQGRAPDLAQIDSYILPRYFEYLQPLDSLISKNNLDINDFFPFIAAVQRGKDGHIYALQFTTDVRVLFYRKDLLTTPPKTWDDVLNEAKSLKQKGFDAFLMPAGRAEGAANTSLWPMFWGQGGELVDSDGKAIFGTGDNRNKLLNIFNFYKTLVDNKYTAPRVANYGNEADLNPDVATGKVAMFLGGNFQIAQLKGIIGEDGLAKWAVAAIPQKAGAKNATSAGGWAWGIFTKDPVKQQAAFDLIMNVYVGDKGMAQWTSIAGYLPTRKSIYTNPLYKSTSYTEAFKTILEADGHLRPSSPSYPKIANELEIALSAVVSGTKQPTQALDDAWQAATK